MKFQCFTLGCKVNQYETQAMEQMLTAMGHEIAEQDCDAYIINTCTVTAVADRKNRTLIHRLRRECPEAVIGVCGCYAQLEAEKVKAMGVDVISGSGGREEFVQMLLQAVRERKEQLVSIDEALKRREFERLCAGGLSQRTRAMLKVQDGCNNFCSYCIIPYARGPVRSLPLCEAVEQAQALAAEGYREIVVTGIEIASWGWDFKDGSKFADLAEALCVAAGEARIRLGSLEPRIVDEDFCKRLSKHGNFCPQFHLSLQSGSDSVLKRMRRKYDSNRYFESVELLNKYFPGCAITTDLIVGFPGETEEELQESLDFCRRCGFAAMHIFPYSRRSGTPADKMEGQVEKQEKSRRAAIAGEVAKSLQESYLTGLLGSEQQVLFEQESKGFFTGHAENGVKVYAKGKNLQNVTCTVRLTALKEDGAEGVLLL